MQTASSMNDAATPDPDGHDTRPSAFMGWLSIAIIFLMVIVAVLDRGIIALMVDPMKRDLGLSDFQISLLQGFAFAAFYAVGGVPMGWLGDRYGRRWILLLGASVWSVMTALCGLAHNFWQLFAARIGVGLGEATLAPSSYAMVPDLLPRNRQALGMGIVASASTVGGAVSLVIGGFAVEWALSVEPLYGLKAWQLVFLVIGLPGLVLAPLVLLIPRTAQRKTKAAEVPAAEYFRWLREHKAYLITLMGAVAFHAVTSYAIASWTPAYMSRVFGMSASAIGASLGGIVAACGIIGAVMAGVVVDALHSRGVRDAHFKFMIGNCAIMIVVGLVTYLVLPTPATLLVGIAALYLLAPFLTVALPHVQLVVPAEFRGRTIAIVTLGVQLLGATVGPSSVALLTENVFGGPQNVGQGLATAVAVSAFLSLVFAALCLRHGRRAIANASSWVSATRQLAKQS